MKRPPRPPTKKSPEQPSSPRFESDRLHGIAHAVAQRGKAIRYHGDLECRRAIEDFGERLNVDFTAIGGFCVRLSIWTDGVLWLGITKPGPRRVGGWAHYDPFHSHLGDLDAPDVLDVLDVLERFEQTIQSPTQAREILATQDGRPGLSGCSFSIRAMAAAG